MADTKILGYDYSVPSVDGTDNVTKYLLGLVNSNPLLKDDEEITFQNIDNSKMSFVPISNVAILSEKTDICGHVKQTCQYSFQIFKTAKALSENNKIRYKEWLDKLGMWLQGQPIMVEGIEYILTEYPPINNNKKIKLIKTAQPSVLYSTSDGKNEAWVIAIDAVYYNEFDR